MVRFGNCPDIRSKSYFIHFRKSEDLQSDFKFAGCHVLSELADIGRSHDCDNVVAFPERVGKLENLGFVGNGSKGAAYHTHTAGYAFVLQDTCPSLFVASDGLHSTGLFAGADIMGDRVIRTDGLAFSAFNTFILVDDRLAVDHGNGAFGADLNTGMSHASPAHIGDNIFIWRTGRAGRGDHLHQRRLIIFFVNVACLQPISQMNRFVFRTKRKSHGEADTLAGNRPFPINTVTVFGPLLDNLIGDGFNVVDQCFV